jgi:chromosome segregation ATPase
MIDDSDLRGLSAADARAYIFEFLTSLKATERELAGLGEEISSWTKRVALAAAKGAAELETAARARLAELEAKQATLNAEKAELGEKIARMKEKLPLISASERSVDADLLLAQLQMATGEALDPLADAGAPPASATAANIDALGANDALAELKKKLSLDGPDKE